MKTNSKHTPGPWTSDGKTIDHAGGWGVACAMGFGSATEANARLIAAAPDLLAACRRAVHLYDHDDATSVLEWVNSPEFRAAIAKAEGGAA